jgi:hypothetical protein
MRAHLYSNSSESEAAGFVRQNNRALLVSEDLTPGHPGGALRGLAIAVALAVPVWLALYLLLR